MAVEEWHEFDDYRFQETLHGPNVERQCADCGGHCYSIPDYHHPRCEECSMKVRGVPRPVDRIQFIERPHRPSQGPGLSGYVNQEKRREKP